MNNYEKITSKEYYLNKSRIEKELLSLKNVKAETVREEEINIRQRITLISKGYDELNRYTSNLRSKIAPNNPNNQVFEKTIKEAESIIFKLKTNTVDELEKQENNRLRQVTSLGNEIIINIENRIQKLENEYTKLLDVDINKILVREQKEYEYTHREEIYKAKQQREREDRERKILEEKAEKERIENEKIQHFRVEIKQKYSDLSPKLFNELLQIHYPEHYNLILRGKEIDFLKAILQGQNLDQIQDISFFFADKIYLPLSEKKRHVFIVATNGSGKSEAIKYLIFQEFKHDKTGVILIDPHGDLSEQTAKLKGKDNSKLVYISLRLSNEHTPKFNPFDVDNRNPLDVERQAKDMVLALAEIVGTSFSEYMERILFSCIYLLMMQGNKTISDLADMMRDSEVERVQRIAKSLPNERVRAFFEHDFSNKQFESTKHSINQKLGNLVDETPFRELTTGKSTIDLKKCVNEGYKVIFDLSGLSKEAKNAYGRMVISQLHFLAYSRENSTHRPSVFVYVDEFQRFVSNTINEGLAELRKYGFHFVLATQNLTNLDTKTEKNVLSNTNIKIVGMNDYNTNNKMFKELRMVSTHSLDKLEKAQFYIRAGTGHAQLVTVPSNLIDNKANMSRSKWEQVRAEQLSNYYELRATTPTATAEPREPQREQATEPQNDPLSSFKGSSSIKPLDMDI